MNINHGSYLFFSLDLCMAHKNCRPRVPAHWIREEEPVRPQVGDLALFLF